MLVEQVDHLDADPWSLNVRNGIIDLRTGRLRVHDPALLMTRLADLIEADLAGARPLAPGQVVRLLGHRAVVFREGGDDALALHGEAART